MNFLSLLPLHFPFLDVAFGPSFSMGETTLATKIILLAVLALFLLFIGYLIWKSIKK